MRKLIFAFVIIAIIISSLSVMALAEAKGCGVANCHAIGDKWDLAAEANNVEKHPPVKAGSLYEDCAKCHKSGKLAFGPILHKGHHHEGENHFTSNPDNGCQSCHKVDLATGDFSVVYAK